MLILFVFMSGSALAQDTIFLINNNMLKAHVIHIGSKEIKFKHWNEIDASIFSIGKGKVIAIHYQNGDYEIINTIDSSEYFRYTTIEKKDKIPLGRNIISLNIFSMVFGGVTFGYEHFNKADKISYKIPFTIGYLKPTAVFGGFQLKFFPSKVGKARYYLGPNIQGGVRPVDHGFGNSSRAIFGTVLFSNGISFQPSRHFNIALEGGFGPAVLDYDNQRKFGFILDFGFNLGIRF